MGTNKDYLTIEQMETLISKGVDVSNASARYDSFLGRAQLENGEFEERWSSWRFMIGQESGYENKDYRYIPAFSLSDILERIPKKITHPKSGQLYYPVLVCGAHEYKMSIQRASYDCLVGTHFEKTAIDAAYSLYLWCIENRYVK